MSAHSHDGESDEAPPAPAPDPSRDVLLGMLVSGKYRVHRLIARGGMGRIYLAEQEPLGRSVALKVLDARYVQSDQDPEFQKRFLLEASTCARLTHPNTVKVYDYGRLEDTPEETYFMVMEYIDGRTLRQALKDYGHFPAARALRVTREIARSLREAHRQGVVHRDLKPSNVMLVASDEGESVKVLDFGIVKVMRDDFGDLTQGGRFLGSPRYMSPEVIRHTDVDTRSDIYSVGVLLYEMLAGKPPFAGEKSVSTMMAHLNDPVPTIKSRTGVDVAVQVEAIARRCLEKDPRNRIQSSEELIAVIDQLIRDLGLDAGPGARNVATLSPALVSEPSFPGSASFPSSSTNTGSTPVNWQTQAQGTGSFTHPPVPPAPSGGAERERWRLISFVSMLVTIAVLLALVLRREVAAPAPAAPQPKAAAVAPTEPPRAPPTQPNIVTPSASAVIVTTPDAVEVVENNRVLGVTPMTLAIDPVALTRQPRLIVLRKEGYQSQSIELGPVPAGTVLQRTLLRNGVKAAPPKRPASPAGKPLDIRTTR
jgi:serine/threonine-protein kinase